MNQSIFKSSWVPNLAKCMHGMCDNNERYNYKIVRWIQKTMQCMWILNINDAKKKKNRLVKYLKIENFSVSIGRALIEYQLSQVEARLEKSGIFWLIENHTRSIENLEKPNFWKTEQFYAETPQSIVFFWIKCMSIRWNIFQKHLWSTQIFQKHIFESICPQQLKH